MKNCFSSPLVCFRSEFAFSPQSPVAPLYKSNILNLVSCKGQNGISQMKFSRTSLEDVESIPMETMMMAMLMTDDGDDDSNDDSDV